MRKLMLTSLLILAACSARLELSLSPDTPVSVRDSTSVHEIQPGTPDHQALQNWISRNQTGWSKHYATPPSGGILVSDGNIALRFFGNGVLVHRDGQLWGKSVQESEYNFLRKAPGT
ncbi:hypothetical protein [Thermomonas carbonis]|uniref:Uncharacterized protein n=1 Tax=Thermomonas carbonis TaxID=1463158 RepID=A0A7G9SNN0_9GAMM|nr:hypothetical protein [Thermomonas carbonis]QNN69455.1 hypothetical protein H9L16_12320 [Thermomonas carbonis]